jgi:hypothetical protein
MHYGLHCKMYAPAFGRGQIRPRSSALGWNDPTGHFGHEVVGKRGVVPAQYVFCPRPNSLSRTVQPQCSSTLWFTRRVNEMVNGGVICVFHAPVTRLSKLCL